MKNSVAEFLEIYMNRPIKDNRGGMGFNHSWATWFLIKNLKPSIILESGIYRGHSTWLLETAAPNCKLFCFDLNLTNREFISRSARYYEKDLTEFDWSKHDLSNSIAFIDDHQNHLKRLIDCNWFGIKKIILEDVFPENEGDFYSLKHIQNKSGIKSLQLSEMYKGNILQRKKRKKIEKLIWSLGGNQNLLVTPNGQDWYNLEKNLRFFEEMPPVYLEKLNQWGKPYSKQYKTKVPLFAAIPLKEVDYSYSYLTYVELI